MLNYKKRGDTKGIVIHNIKTNKTYKEYLRERLGNGWFDTGFHYVVDGDGTLILDREDDSVSLFKDDCIHIGILCAIPLTSNQKSVVDNLVKELKIKYKNVGELNDRCEGDY